MSLVADFTGGLFGIVVVRGAGVLGGDGLDIGNGVLSYYRLSSRVIGLHCQCLLG